MENQPNLIDPTPVARPPHKSPDHWFVVVTLILAVVGYFIASYYFAVWPFEKSAGPVVENTPTPSPAVKDPTAGWQTYRNEEYGFEFKYPGDWKVEEEIDSSEYLIWFWSTESKTEPETDSPFRVFIEPTSFVNIDQWFKNIPEERYVNKEYSILEIGNISAIQYSYMTGIGGCDDHYAFIRKSFIYYIERGSATCNYGNEIFNQILSTFKFTK